MASHQGSIRSLRGTRHQSFSPAPPDLEQHMGWPSTAARACQSAVAPRTAMFYGVSASLWVKQPRASAGTWETIDPGVALLWWHRALPRPAHTAPRACRVLAQTRPRLQRLAGPHRPICDPACGRDPVPARRRPELGPSRAAPQVALRAWSEIHEPLGALPATCRPSVLLKIPNCE